MRGCEAIENFSDAVFHADSVVHRCFRRCCSVFLLSIRSLSVDLQASLLFPCVTSKRFFELMLSQCHFYVTSLVIFRVYISSWDLDWLIRQQTTATAGEPSLGTPHVMNKGNRQKWTLTRTILLYHLTAVQCFLSQLFIVVNNLLFLTFCCK